jgi:hypothetical protein
MDITIIAVGVWILAALVVLVFMASSRSVSYAETNDVKERRVQPRKRPNCLVKVFDAATEDVLGFVVDISKGGVRLVCDRSLPVERRFRLRLDVSPDDSSMRGGLREATTVWCRNQIAPDPNSLGYHVGLRFD